MRETPAPDWLLDQGTPIGKGDHPLRELIADLVDELPPTSRRVIEAWAYEGLTYQQIADEFGLAGRQGGQDRVNAALRLLQKKLLERGIGARTCKVGRCTQPHHAKGYCKRHYDRRRSHA